MHHFEILDRRRERQESDETKRSPRLMAYKNPRDESPQAEGAEAPSCEDDGF